MNSAIPEISARPTAAMAGTFFIAYSGTHPLPAASFCQERPPDQILSPEKNNKDFPNVFNGSGAKTSVNRAWMKNEKE